MLNQVMQVVQKRFCNVNTIGRLGYLTVRFCSKVEDHSGSKNDEKEADINTEKLYRTAHDKTVKVPATDAQLTEKVTDILQVNNEKYSNMFGHLTLHEAVKKDSDAQKKPLVILFQWLYAKPSAVNKYCALYHSIGLDVLTVRGKLSHFLWSPEGEKLSSELFNYLKLNRAPDEKIIVHAFSVGTCNYTCVLQQALRRQEESGHFRDRIVGQIFDSIVTGTHGTMSTGIAEVLPENVAFRRLVLNLLDTYNQFAEEAVKENFNNLLLHFKMDPICVPTLFFSSMNDPLCNDVMMEELLSEWKAKEPEFEVTKVSWPKSKHAAHLREHKDEYMAAWTLLMKRLQLI